MHNQVSREVKHDCHEQIHHVFRVDAWCHARSEQRSQKDANRQRSRDLDQNIAAAVIHNRAGGCGHADHEIRRRRSHHERYVHEQVHHRNFNGSASDTEQA